MTAAKKPSPQTTAAQKEATDEPTMFEHGGIEYTVPAPLDMPVGLLEATDEIEAIRLILGDDQWTRYKNTGATLRDFQVFADKVAQAAGNADSGN
ncbi:hypothetical protein [Streptomyces rectiverticillatus]|uniref:hypothetical protein n=1 Tax=Streptomyces rectiverticillatus TaxID=173860 RepID=UPI001FE64120|nr:hypothetical protein [Streptomyces rectiverticillatus]